MKQLKVLEKSSKNLKCNKMFIETKFKSYRKKPKAS